MHPLPIIYFLFLMLHLRYGDFHPTRNATIWFCIFFIPVCVYFISTAIVRIANIFVEREIQKSHAKLLYREMTVDDLEIMSRNGNGEVSPLEFVEHMLLSMNKVDAKLLEELHAQFNILDADGSGGLQMADIDILTRRGLSRILSSRRDGFHDNSSRDDDPSSSVLLREDNSDNSDAESC